MNPPVYTALLAAAAFLLVRATGFLGYVFNNPDALHFGFFTALSGYGADFLLAALMIGGFCHIGKQILPAFRLSGDSAEDKLIAVALGEAVVSALLLFAGLAGGYHIRIFLPLLLVLAYGTYRERGEIAGLVRNLWQILARRISLFQWVCVAILGVALLRAAVASAAPPTDWDTLAYHLAFPKIFLQEGKLVRLPWSTNAHYPLGSEMIYLPALAFGREMASHWINLFHGLGVLALIFCFARRLFPAAARPAGLFAAALYAVQPAFRKVTGNAATDMNVTFAMLLAITLFLRMYEAEEKNEPVAPEDIGRRALLCGLLAGIAMSLKLTGTWIVLTLFIAIGATRPRGRTLRHLALFCAGACVTGAAWYAKNWFWTGNPIWPYMSGIFGGTPTELDAWTRMRASITEGVPKTLLNFILTPYFLIFKGDLFHYATQYLMIPFLALLAAIMSVGRKDSSFGAKKRLTGTETRVLMVIVIYMIIWFWVFQDWRYALPAGAIISVLIAGWAMQVWNEAKGKIWRFAAAVAAVGIIPVREMGVNNELFVAFNLKSKQAPGLSARDRYLFGALGPVYAVSRVASATLPKDARIFFYRDVRGYYVDPPYVWGDPLNPGVFSFRDLQNSGDLRRRLLDYGFTHVLYNPYIGNYKGDQDYYRRADDLMEGTLRDSVKRAELGGVALYELKAI